MTYPPTNSGYPVPQQPGGYGAPAAPSYSAPAHNKMPMYLTVGVVVLGLAAYLASFGPLLSINTDVGPFGGAEFTASGLSYWTVAALVAALLAAVGLLPAAKNHFAVIAVAAVLGVLLVLGQAINRPNGFSIGWALWLVVAFTLLQAIAAVAALLFESGVLKAPAPRPQYGQFGQYGPPPSGYYGQPNGPAPPQRPGYPAPFPGGYPTSPSASGYGPYGGPSDTATDTPPTGFPSFTPSPSAGSSQLPSSSGQPPLSFEPPSGPTSSS
ncbi:DUF5336 domain-containing protein [Mycolicibacterium sp.]|uniref:DUF5336 domain-containing protein n=1 Tax=Mycolicibacterium sp. TaxID=2320850 RepID=UPI001A2549E6|nr:DUF5336 domain-containing protein [Mycolicibacterium sp.]MBJ7401267.1 DUF5336 domain-containing protein [Mycolicibacterium sp.]